MDDGSDTEGYAVWAANRSPRSRRRQRPVSVDDVQTLMAGKVYILSPPPPKTTDLVSQRRFEVYISGSMYDR